MSSVQSTSWEQELADLLSELSNVQQELLELLAAKRQCMAASNIEQMLELQPREQHLCERLQACHERRGELLRQAADCGLPHKTLEELASSLSGDKREKVSKQVKKSAVSMRALQLESLTNWVLAQRAMLHMAQLLEIVVTGGRLQPTYERGSSSLAPSGALVDSEA